MSAVKSYYIYCNGKDCPYNGEEASGGEGSIAYGGSLKNYRKHLRRGGWTCTGKHDYCEKCSAARRPTPGE